MTQKLRTLRFKSCFVAIKAIERKSLTLTELQEANFHIESNMDWDLVNLSPETILEIPRLGLQGHASHESIRIFQYAIAMSIYSNPPRVTWGEAMDCSWFVLSLQERISEAQRRNNALVPVEQGSCSHSVA